LSALETEAKELDRIDPLRGKRHLFARQNQSIYLDGNSLGLMPASVPDRLKTVATQQWAEGLIHSWNDANWFDMPLTVGDKIAPLIGAKQGEVADRPVILVEADNFPTDVYMAQGLANLVPDVNVRYFEQTDDLATAVTADVGVVLMSHVDYRTARIQDMTSVTRTVQTAGALMLWDLSHTTGAVHCNLSVSNCDMAVGCTYKFLNGGPGSPAFTWIHPEHANLIESPLSGWMGHTAPFDFTRQYIPAAGARRMVCGTPQILSLSALDAALDLWADLDLSQLWEKSSALTDFFIRAVESQCAEHGLQLLSPREALYRGSHVSFTVDEGGFEIIQALASLGIVADFRSPNIIRFGFAPLYVSFSDVLQAVNQLSKILDTGIWDDDQFRIRNTVT